MLTRIKKIIILSKLYLAGLLILSFCLLAPSYSLAATYTADRTETTNGGSSWGKEILLFEASIDGADATFTVSNVDSNATIPSDGMMFLKSGDTFRTTEECDDSETIMSKDVDPDTPSVKFYPNLDAVSNSYPVTFYVCYRNWLPGVTAWSGPITISRPENSATITSPPDNATIEGDFTLSCEAEAPEGLKEVNVYFGDNNLPVVMCKDGTGAPCPTFKGSWDKYNVNPLNHGVSEAGVVKMMVLGYDENDDPFVSPVIKIVWSPETPPSSGSTGSITSPGNSAEGNFTVSAEAEDPAGLEKVSVVFSSGGTLVLCEDGTSDSCSDPSDSWSENIDPAKYGMTDAGTYTLSLWVSNEDGDSPERVDRHTVTWSPVTLPSSGSTGSITSPGSSAEGNFTVSAKAEDPAGLEKVSVVFPSGDTLVLCEDGTSTTCSGNSDSWTEPNIDPAEYGITSEGTYTLSLWVVNEDGDSPTRVDTQAVDWSPDPVPVNTPPSGSFTAPSGLVNGLVTIRATASDADGLQKVSVVFAPDGASLVLCDDASSHTCSGIDGSWEMAGINPEDYGAKPGSINFDLHVQDENEGNTTTLVASTEFTWIPPNNQFPKDSKYFNVCVGHNYEQQMPLEGTTMPSVSFSDAPISVSNGENVTLHTNGSVDTANGGSDFYYYCTRQGSLLYDEAQPDQVSWIAPLTPEYRQSVKLYVQIGDGLGYIDSEVKTVNVSGSITKKVFSSSGLIYPGETLRQSVPLGSFINKLVGFIVKWPGSDIDLLLTKPDGTSLDYTGDTVVGYYEGKTKEYYVVYNDQEGTWEIDLKAIDVAEEGEPYEFIVYVDEGSASGADTDQDGIPDSWEIDQFGDLSHDATTDADNDGLNDFDEFQRGADPNNPDSDYDGMPDGWEVQHGLDPLTNDSNGDADKDGFSNLDEYNAGTDPQDASSMPIQCATTVPDDFTGIQAAADYVAITDFGGNVCVQPGTYVEPKLKLKDGVYLVALSDDPAETIIDGDGKNDVITFHNVRVGGVIGFTLRNSKSKGNAAAIKVAGGKQMPLIARNIITDNKHGIRLQGNVRPLVINNTVAEKSGDDPE